VEWSELVAAQPRLAELARQRLLDPGVVLVVTIRGDGSPRLSPVEPFVLDGSLWLSMLWRSRKATDLLRDPRILVHSIVTAATAGKASSRFVAAPAREQPGVAAPLRGCRDREPGVGA
jgi:hypothetical protein